MRTAGGLLTLILLMLSGMGSFADPVCAKGYITLRKKPGGVVSWKVATHMPFVRLENKNGWSRLKDLDGEEHWAQSKDLNKDISCVVVKAQVATLREHPTANAQPAEIRTVDRYTPLKKIDTNHEWIRVEDENGRQSWIHEANVWKPVQIQTMSF